MSQGVRIKREPPRRGKPQRMVSLALKPASPPSNRSARVGKARHQSEPRGAVSKGVELAYQVIDKYLQQGRESAGRQGTHENERGPMNRNNFKNDPQHMTAAAMQMWTQMASMWMGAMNPWAMAGIYAANRPFDLGGQDPKSQAPAARPQEKLGLMVTVSSNLRADLTVDLVDRAPAQPVATPLTALESGKPPIPIQFNQANGRLQVHVKVPGDQPAGEYYGMLFEASDPQKNPRGHLRLTVSPAPSSLQPPHSNDLGR